MIESRSVERSHFEHVIRWNDISCGLCEKLGFKHLRDVDRGDDGPGFDFWMYFISQITEYMPDGRTESPVDIVDHIYAIENEDCTYPHADDQKALPILKALVEILPEGALKDGFYVDFC